MGLVRVSGTWRDAEPYVRVSNVWRLCESEHVRVGGAWRETWRASVMQAGYMTGNASYIEHRVPYEYGTSLLIYAHHTEVNTEAEAIGVSREPVNLTNVSEITFRFSTPIDSGPVIFSVANSQMGDSRDSVRQSDFLYNARFNSRYNLNVSDLSGNFYIKAIAIRNASLLNDQPKPLYLHEIQLDGVTFFDGTN